MFCGKCGASIGDNAKFCHQCGTKMLTPEAASSGARYSPTVEADSSLPADPALAGVGEQSETNQQLYQQILFLQQQLQFQQQLNASAVKPEPKTVAEHKTIATMPEPATEYKYIREEGPSIGAWFGWLILTRWLPFAGLLRLASWRDSKHALGYVFLIASLIGTLFMAFGTEKKSTQNYGRLILILWAILVLLIIGAKEYVNDLLNDLF